MNLLFISSVWIISLVFWTNGELMEQSCSAFAKFDCSPRRKGVFFYGEGLNLRKKYFFGFKINDFIHFKYFFIEKNRF